AGRPGADDPSRRYRRTLVEDARRMDLQRRTAGHGERSRPRREAAAPLIALQRGAREIDPAIFPRQERRMRRARIVLRQPGKRAALEQRERLAKRAGAQRPELPQERLTGLVAGDAESLL